MRHKVKIFSRSKFPVALPTFIECLRAVVAGKAGFPVVVIIHGDQCLLRGLEDLEMAIIAD
jgi:hypothetical protein